MSVIQISYKFASYREKVEPGINLNDILPRSLKHFKLSGENKDWALHHGGTQLPLSVPLRLLNLASGATLELKDNQQSETGNKILKIKFSVLKRGTDIWIGSPSTKVLEAVQNVFDRNSWPLTAEKLKLQCFAKIFEYEQLRNSTFAQLGIVDNVSVRISFIPSGEQAIEQHKAAKTHISPVAEEQVSQKTSIKDEEDQSSKPKDHCQEIAAYIPDPEAPLISHSDQEEDFELTVNHLKKYQNMLSKNAGGNHPLLTKRLQEKESPPKTIENCNVRIRFPDRTCIDINFRPDDTVHLVYEAVARCLNDKTAPFALFHSHPHKQVPDNDSKLVADAKFGSKTLLILQTTQSDVKLRSDLLKKAKTFSDLRETGDSKAQTVPSPVPNSPEKKPSKGLRVGQTPKWLKLGKK
ncbi:LAME_0E01068g1_1 [Lachancea meyersii CBS 8951]|uniref:LAME_0E01068g1_1 n=1 Tax=Lachancea meyersii CBS 8951 TaxID=1266667 RepID=A0A1G4JET1_9SACH|nr:LAME_0E01068g1_1 [Lachancea meyersii CBS 8951]